MRTRGRKSTAELTVTPLAPKPPAPPAELGPEAATEWRAVTARMPSDWWGPENYALLTSYCRSIVEARRLSATIDLLDQELAREVAEDGRSALDAICTSSRTRDRLLRMRYREVMTLSSLATRMRLSQQSSYDKTKAVHKHPEGPRPWDM
jgi:hypothetical protein